MKLAAVILLVLPRLALADGPREITLEPVCAEVDTNDSLDEAARKSARDLLARTLERENQLVVETGCTQTYRVGHHLADGRWTVRIAGPNGSRRWTDATPDKHPEIYRDVVRVLIALPPRTPTARPAPAVPQVEVPQPAVAPATPPPVPDLEAEPAPLTQREIERTSGSPPPAPFPTPDLGTAGNEGPTGFYGTLGFGGGGGIGGGMAAGFGLRRGYGSLAFDGSLSLLSGNQGGAFRASFEVLRIAKARVDRRADEGVGFIGGGLSIGGTDIGDPEFFMQQTTGSGFAGELTAGYMFESEGSSLFVQADLSLPLYNAGSAYPATFSVAIGYGAL